MAAPSSDDVDFMQQPIVTDALLGRLADAYVQSCIISFRAAHCAKKKMLRRIQDLPPCGKS